MSSKEEINDLLLNITYKLFMASMDAPDTSKTFIDTALDDVHTLEELCNRK